MAPPYRNLSRTAPLLEAQMRKQNHSKLPRRAATAAAIAAVSAAIYPAFGEQTGDAVTISLSGSTAIRNFTTSAGFTFLNPGTSITLHSGPGGTPMTYTAPSRFRTHDPPRPGQNPQGGQNRAQMAIRDVPSVQGFAKAGASAYPRPPGEAGYGKGNPALALAAAGDIQGLGAAGVRHQLNDESTLNMPTTA